MGDLTKMTSPAQSGGVAADEGTQPKFDFPLSSFVSRVKLLKWHVFPFIKILTYDGVVAHSNIWEYYRLIRRLWTVPKHLPLAKIQCFVLLLLWHTLGPIWYENYLNQKQSVIKVVKNDLFQILISSVCLAALLTNHPQSRPRESRRGARFAPEIAVQAICLKELIISEHSVNQKASITIFSQMSSDQAIWYGTFLLVQLYQATNIQCRGNMQCTFTSIDLSYFSYLCSTKTQVAIHNLWVSGHCLNAFKWAACADGTSSPWLLALHRMYTICTPLSSQTPWSQIHNWHP